MVLLATICLNMLGTLNRSSAERMVDYAHLMVSTQIKLNPENTEWNWKMLRKIAKAYHKIGNDRKSDKVQRRFQELSRGHAWNSYEPQYLITSQGFVEIKDFIDKGDIDSVMTYVHQGGVNGVYAAIQLADYYIDRNEKDKASELLNIAYTESLKEKKEEMVKYFWGNIAYSLGKLGKFEEAYALIEKKSERVYLYCSMISVLARYGYPEESFKLLHEKEFDLCKVSAMVSLALVFHEKGWSMNRSQEDILKEILKAAANPEK